MSDSKPDETYYDILKVDAKATVSEIVAAYHMAKNTFSPESVATYSLFSSEDSQTLLSRIEEAYRTLSNIERRREYDMALAQRDGNPAALEEFTERASEDEPPPTRAFTGTPGPLPEYDVVSGPVLKEIRERRTLSIEDVCRITKIPTKFIHAIERDSLKALPARVYLQGFVKNMAALYKLDPQTTVVAYLAYLDKLQKTG